MGFLHPWCKNPELEGGGGVCTSASSAAVESMGPIGRVKPLKPSEVHIDQ